MKKVYICSPLGGDVEENLRKVKKYTEFALRCGTAPVVPHFYALCLDDTDPVERQMGLNAGLSLLMFCDEMWIFGDKISEGMRKEIRACENLNIRMRYMSLDMSFEDQYIDEEYDNLTPRFE